MTTADDIIISRDRIRSKARTAYYLGFARDSHCMNPGAPALDDWLAEWDRCQRVDVSARKHWQQGA